MLYLKSNIQFLVVEGKKIYRDELIKRAKELSEKGYAHYYFTQEETAKPEVKAEASEKTSKKKAE